MTALITGILFILLAVYSVIPGISWGPDWGAEVLTFIKGVVPVLVLFIGLVAVLIGMADLRDRRTEKKASRDVNENESGE